MNPEVNYYIQSSNKQRPKSKCTIFVDGTAEDNFRENIDIELSHWIPNRTPEKYKAGTSTEICFNFLDDRNAPVYDLVINNHIDIDGLLSTFVLSYPSVSLKHRKILCDASKIGDFWDWSDGKALPLFQEVTFLYKNLLMDKISLHDIYEKCFERILTILKMSVDNCKAQEILQHQFSLVKRGKIARYELTPQLVAYYVPQSISLGDIESFMNTPNFNEPISDRLSFWPQVRNRLDAEKIQLVGIETSKGNHFDLWYPGYSWADTKGLWRPIGLNSPIKAGDFQSIINPELEMLFKKLNALEPKRCKWELFPGISFFNNSNPKPFPIVATTIPSSEGYYSDLPLDRVMSLFYEIW